MQVEKREAGKQAEKEPKKEREEGKGGSGKDSSHLGYYCLKLEMREEFPVHSSEREKQNPGAFLGASSGCSCLSGKARGGRGRNAGWWEH